MIRELGLFVLALYGTTTGAITLYLHYSLHQCLACTRYPVIVPLAWIVLALGLWAIPAWSRTISRRVRER